VEQKIGLSVKLLLCKGFNHRFSCPVSFRFIADRGALQTSQNNYASLPVAIALHGPACASKQKVTVSAGTPL